MLKELMKEEEHAEMEGEMEGMVESPASDIETQAAGGTQAGPTRQAGGRSKAEIDLAVSDRESKDEVDVAMVTAELERLKVEGERETTMETTTSSSDIEDVALSSIVR